MQKRTVSAASTPVTAPVTASAPDPAPGATAEVSVRLVEPTSGVTLLIDGMVQPVGVLSFARPAAGATKELTARAPGYEEKVFHLDATTESIDVVLEKEDAATATTAAARAQEPAPKAQPQTKAEPKSGNTSQPVETKASAEKPKDKGKGPAKIDVPDNPF